ncbi:MAG: heparan-alpha-glucosaminide N-acetyltransferase [Acutalibacteraceae bacterium]
MIFIKTKNKIREKNCVSGRIWELDFLKGIAFIFMVWDHVVYDLEAFFGMNTASLGFFKEGIGIISAVIFMTVCGISVTLGKKNLRHALTVGAAAIFLTLFTFTFDKVTGSDTVIWFGILHFLSLSMLIGHFAKKLPRFVLLIMAAGSFILGKYFSTLMVSTDYFAPFGLCSAGFYSSDYFPLFPNIAYTFIGIVIGKTLYTEKKSIFARSFRTRAINFLGRHTLVLYIIHQPIVLAVLYVINFIIAKIR